MWGEAKLNLLAVRRILNTSRKDGSIGSHIKENRRIEPKMLSTLSKNAKHWMAPKRNQADASEKKETWNA